MPLYFISFFLQPANGAVASYTQLILRNNGFSHSAIGVIRAVGQLATIIFPLLISDVTERKSKEKLVLILCLLLGLGSYIPVFYSYSVLVVTIFYFLFCSFFWSMNPISDGYITKCCNGNSETYGRIRSVGTFGYVIFMILFAITGFPSETNNFQIMLNCIILDSILLVCYLFGPKYKVGSGNEEVVSARRSAGLAVNRRKKYDLKWVNKPFVYFMISVAISRISTAVIDNLLSSYMTEELKLGSSFTIFVAIGAMGEIVMLTLGGRLIKKNKVKPLFFFSLSCVAFVIRLLMYVFFKSIPMFVIAQLLHAFTFAACHIACTSYISTYIEKEHYSVAMTIYWSLGINFPLLIGTLLGGFIIDAYGFNTLFLLYTVFPAVSLLLSILWRKVINFERIGCV